MVSPSVRAGERSHQPQRPRGLPVCHRAEVLDLGAWRNYEAPFLSGRSIVSYTLHKLASGSYDLHLDGELIGGVVRVEAHRKTWIAELLVDAPPDARPRPFTEVEHTFSFFEELQRWLGDAPVCGPAMIA